MKILFPFVGDTIGGSHHSAALLMAALPEHGIEPIGLVHRPGPLLAFLHDRGIAAEGPTGDPVWQADGGPISGLLRLLLLTPRLWWVLRRLAPDVVHVNDGRMTISWSLACFLASIPLIVHQRQPYKRSRILYLALRVASRIIAISAFTVRSLPPELRSRTRQIANPFVSPSIDTKAVRTNLDNEFRLDPKVPVLAVIGTIENRKRQNLAVEALAKMAGTGIRAFLLVVGRMEGRSGDALRDLIARLGLDDTVRLLGYRNDVNEILAATDVVLAPAVNEAHGRVLVEAMLAGTPVVAAASGGHLETIRDGETGLLVAPDDPGALADAAARLLSDAALAARLSAAAQAEARTRYGVAAHARAMADLYRRVVGAR